jgi:hypothetical protein
MQGFEVSRYASDLTIEPALQYCFLQEHGENQLAAKLLVSGLDLKWVL